MKKLISLLMASLFVVTGCGNAASDDEMVTVNWTTIGDEPADLQIVQDEMNTILAEDYGVQVDFTYIGYDSYSEQLGLQMSSGNPLDIVFAPSWSLDFMTNVNDGLYYPLNDLLNDEFKSTINESFWDGVTVDGNIYAVPTDKELAPTKFALFDADKVDELGYDLSAVENFEDALNLSKQYYEDTGIEGTYIDKGWLGAYKMFEYDCVPSLDYQVCLDTDNPDEGYKWLYDFDEYKDLAEEMNGLINEGVIATKPGELYQWQNTDAFMHTQDGLPTSTASWEANDGKNYESIQMLEPLVTTDTVRGSLNVISANSEHPEEAMTVLEAFNTDERLRNLNAFGIEGTHYTLNDDGKVVYTDAAKQYMPGIYTQGDYDTMLLLADEPDDTRQIMADFNDEAIVSPALGFTPDLTEYQAQVANILNINNKYNASLMNFIYTGDLDSMLEPARAEYEAVGAQDVIDEINKQYEEWQAAQ